MISLMPFEPNLFSGANISNYFAKSLLYWDHLLLYFLSTFPNIDSLISFFVSP